MATIEKSAFQTTWLAHFMRLWQYNESLVGLIHFNLTMVFVTHLFTFTLPSHDCRSPGQGGQASSVEGDWDQCQVEVVSTR